MPPRGKQAIPVQDVIRLLAGITACLCILLLTIGCVWVAIITAGDDSITNLLGGVSAGGVASGVVAILIVLRYLLRDAMGINNKPPQEPAG